MSLYQRNNQIRVHSLFVVSQCLVRVDVKMAGRVSGTEAVNVHLDTAANGAKQVCHCV